MELPNRLLDEIGVYCKANNMTDIEGFMTKMVQLGFTVEKYGATPREVEKVIEKIVEVPVHMEVVKEVFITDDKQMSLLTEEIERLNKLRNIDQMDNKQMLDEMVEMKKELDSVKKELIEEKKKNKTDLYGE